MAVAFECFKIDLKKYFKKLSFTDEIELSYKYFGEHWRNEGLLSGKQVDVGKSLRETMHSVDKCSKPAALIENEIQGLSRDTFV